MNTWDFIRNTTKSVEKFRNGRVLTQETAAKIKEMLAEKIPRKKIADEMKHLGVKPHHIVDIALGKIYKDA